MKKNLTVFTIIFICCINQAFSQLTQFNHIDYFNPFNRYLLTNDAIRVGNEFFICGSSTDHLYKEYGQDFGLNGFLIKTDKDGTPVQLPSPLSGPFNLEYIGSYNGSPSWHSKLTKLAYSNTGGRLFATMEGPMMNDLPTVIEIDPSNGSIINSIHLTSVSSFGSTSGNVAKILIDEVNSHIYIICRTEINQAHKINIHKFDFSLTLLNSQVYSFLFPPPNNISEDNWFPVDAYLHTNSVTNQEEIVITGDAQNIQNYTISALDHPTVFYLRILKNTIAPINVTFYPYFYRPSNIYEASHASAFSPYTTSSSTNGFLIGGLMDRTLTTKNMLLLNINENGGLISNSHYFLRNNNPSTRYNIPKTILPYFERGELSAYIFGENWLTPSVYTDPSEWNFKYTHMSQVFLMDFNFQSKTVNRLLNFNKLMEDSIYATKMLNFRTYDNSEVVMFGTYLSKDPNVNPSRLAYHINDINWDRTDCVKEEEEFVEETGEIHTYTFNLQSRLRSYITVPITFTSTFNSTQKTCTRDIVSGQRLFKPASILVSELDGTILHKMDVQQFNYSGDNDYLLGLLKNELINLERNRLYIVKIINNEEVLLVKLMIN